MAKRKSVKPCERLTKDLETLMKPTVADRVGERLKAYSEGKHGRVRVMMHGWALQLADGRLTAMLGGQVPDVFRSKKFAAECAQNDETPVRVRVTVEVLEDKS